MLLNSWSIALLLCGLIVLFLMGLAARSAIRVLLFWNPESDSNRQIRLENEIWLTSTLVEYALGIQIISLIVFVLAADFYSQSIAGAMCATGSLLANSFGVPALLVKIGGVFFYGFWIVLHHLDIHSEKYPLVRVKYIYLLFLIPLLVLDLALEILFITGLKPDIITSCCAVVFGDATGGGSNLLGGFTHGLSMGLFYGTAGALILLGVVLLERWQRWLGVLFSSGWLWFFLLALTVVTTEFSSYIYAMPFHKCPFCILQPEYHYIGFVIYFALFLGAFFGMSGAVVEPLRFVEGLEEGVTGYQRSAVKLSLLFLVFFVLVSSYHYWRYILIGGEG
ncbi:MAG: hypothetical protein L3J49_07870 [Desulfobulbaceae bacterium]|nr:hypothetical protein [Desulfobulbaceae bacterium]